MKEYMEFLIVVFMTIAVLGFIIGIIAGSYMIYKYFKDEY